MSIGVRESVRDAFGNALVELGKEDERVIVLDADLAESTRSGKFAKEFPNRFIECGIAEQNMVGVAAGLASVGFVPFVTTFCVFASKRVCDQVSISVAYPRLNVKVCGAYTGLFTGKTGATHQAIEDLALMRAIPNMTVIEPIDAREAALAVKYAAHTPGPMYLRIARDAYPVLSRSTNGRGETEATGTEHASDFDGIPEFMKARTLTEGDDVAIVALGTMVHTALAAREALREKGVSARVVAVSCLKPIDEAGIIRAAAETGAVVTVENHSIIGGLGGACAEVLGEKCPVTLRRVGIRDVFGESGADADLARKYGLASDHVVQVCLDALAVKSRGGGGSGFQRLARAGVGRCGL
ncbi:MAG: transketolase family protein [Firmicutes bacterium]|jgi:transketolase|nr:transketolase family protein [Bacillota bacterium]MDH7494706.1 transketolase C-terminal domain-containing protein [Bacillota bacterium]